MPHAADDPARIPLSHRVPDLGALELLLAVARLGSLGRAARDLGISQPAASSRIRTMERQLGVALLDRSPRGSTLTDAGALVTDWARRVVEAAEAFDAGAQALRDRRDSRLRVAASMTIAEYLLPGWLIALRAERPGTAVSLLAGNSEQVARRLVPVQLTGVRLRRQLRAVWPTGHRPAGPARDLLSLTARGA
ncbi:LysR family transcriptional regulator [Streptomyces sp. NPDC001770]